MSDEHESDDDIVELRGIAENTESASASISFAFSADNIREKLGNDKYALALILTSTRLERILTWGLRRRLDVDKDQFEALWGDETLGTYGQMCSNLDVFEDAFSQDIIDNVAGVRNNLVHDYGYLDDIEDDEDVQQEVEDAILKAIEFIEDIDF